jgi:hypothetical protein
MEAVDDAREVLLAHVECIGEFALGPPGSCDCELQGRNGSTHDTESPTPTTNCQVLAQAGAQLLEQVAVDIDPDPDEAARRLRAAIAYVGIPRPEAAKALGVSEPTLARMLGRKGSDGIRPATWSDLWRAADAFGLPRAWFTADISRIHEIVPDELPNFPNDMGDLRVVSPAQRNAALAREAEALRREAQRSSARQQASPRTKRAPRRRRNGAD